MDLGAYINKDDEFDGTYRDHYFKIPRHLMKEYQRIINQTSKEVT